MREFLKWKWSASLKIENANIFWVEEILIYQLTWDNCFLNIAMSVNQSIEKWPKLLTVCV
jgi:hypothetical protein